MYRSVSDSLNLEISCNYLILLKKEMKIELQKTIEKKYGLKSSFLVDRVKMVAQNMLCMCEVKMKEKLVVDKCVDVNKCLKHVKLPSQSSRAQCIVI